MLDIYYNILTTYVRKINFEAVYLQQTLIYLFSSNFQHHLFQEFVLSNGQCLLVNNLPEHLTVKKLDGHSIVKCYFCTTSTKLKDVKNPVGTHILCTYTVPGHVVGQTR